MIYENFRLLQESFPATAKTLKTCASTKKKFVLVVQNDLSAGLAQLQNASVQPLN